MDNHDLRKLLTQYNVLWKEMDEIYHLLARHYGLSDCALWVLYVLRESDAIFTQKKICEQLSLSKQTVHSALKKLEHTGYITLQVLSGNQKNKRILLTEAGKTLAEQTVDNILQMEQNAFLKFTEQERIDFMQLSKQHVCQLQAEADKILAGE